MGWNNQNNFTLLIVNAAGGFTGLFVYSPVPGAGNLVASIAAAAGTDPYGNTYLAGITSYQPAQTNVVELLNGSIFLGPTPFGGGSTRAQIQQGLNAGILTLETGLNGADTEAFLSLISAVGGGPGALIGSGAVSVTKNLPGSVLELAGRLGLLNGTAPGTPSGGVYEFANGGALRAKGPSGADVILYANDPLNAMSAQGFQNNWTNGARVASQYRLWYGSEVEVIGSLVVPAGVAAGQVIVNLPAAYRPANSQSILGADITTHQSIQFTLGAAGNFSFGGPVANTAVGNTIDFHGQFSLDA